MNAPRPPIGGTFLDVGRERLEAHHLVDACAAAAIVLGVPHRAYFERTTRAIVGLEPIGPDRKEATTATDRDGGLTAPTGLR